MDTFGSSVDLIRIVFLLGVVLSFIYKKLTGVTPGGIIVPGMLVGVLFSSFTAFLIAITNTLICWLFYRLVISRFALSNRWTTLAGVSFSVVLGLVALALVEAYKLIDQETLLLSLISPGLITVGMKKYGFGKTAISALFITSLTGFIGLLLTHIISYHQLTSLTVQLAVYTPLVLASPFIVLPISLVSAILAYYRFGVRGGGYMIAPFLAVVLFSSPWQAVMVYMGVAVSYLAVRLIQKYTLIIGLERFVLSLFFGYFLVTLMDLAAITIGINGYRPSPFIMIIAIAVLTNDLSLQPLRASLKKGITPSLLIAYLTRLAV